ncbi:MAG TPA: hypothetical protein VMP00_16500 [Burkholderiales bacterium]|nr:hypothetical protein [Burkholderiales bacterium]
MSEVYTGMDPVGARRFPTGVDDVLERASAVSWTAIFAGAAAAAALSLLLLILGSGLGLSAVSPWTMEGISAATFGFAAIAWLSFTQLAASGMGGYLAGRLRTKSTTMHTDEVYFRDTAHGFLAWAVATLLTAVVLTSVVGSIVSGGVRAGAAVAGGAASAVGTVAETAAGSAATLATGGGSGELGDTIEYFVDSLFRGDSAGSAAGVQQVNTQQRGAPPAAQQARELAGAVSDIPVGDVTRIFARALRTGTLPQEDERYIGRLIAQRTDLSQQEAEQRVSEGFANVQTTLQEAETTARETADEARKASAYAALWMFVTLLMGAFAASWMAVVGGRQRDAESHPVN